MKTLNLLLNLLFLSAVNGLNANNFQLDTYLQSCDIIYQLNDEKIEAIVIEIGEEEIKYKKCNFQDGPTYVLSKSKIAMIEYRNGDKEYYTQSEPQMNSEEKKVEEEPIFESPVSEDRATANVVLLFSGKKFIANTNIRIGWNGEDIGWGNFKEGFELEVLAQTGQHEILFIDGKKGKGRVLGEAVINILDPDKYHIVHFKYSRMWGKLMLDRIDIE